MRIFHAGSLQTVLLTYDNFTSKTIFLFATFAIEIEMEFDNAEILSNVIESWYQKTRWDKCNIMSEWHIASFVPSQRHK